MGAETEISWAHSTFNPWWGCAKVAPGCAHCYSEAFAKRFNKAAWGPNGTRVLTSRKYWDQPHKWNREAAAAGERRRVFCASMADVFEDWQGPIVDHKGEVLPLTMDHARKLLFELIDATPNLDWLLLTKRPENIRRMWPFEDGRPTPVFPGMPGPLGESLPCRVRHSRENVWLGCSIANQKDADANLGHLAAAAGLGAVTFVSYEPALGPVRFGPSLQFIDWVIAGGESGPSARPSHPEWFRSVLRECRESGNTSYHFKQWGEWLPRGQMPAVESALWHVVDGKNRCKVPHKTVGLDGWQKFNGDALTTYRVGKVAAGRLLDGKAYDEFPNVPQPERNPT